MTLPSIRLCISATTHSVQGPPLPSPFLPPRPTFCLPPHLSPSTKSHLEHTHPTSASTFYRSRPSFTHHFYTPNLHPRTLKTPIFRDWGGFSLTWHLGWIKYRGSHPHTVASYDTCGGSGGVIFFISVGDPQRRHETSHPQPKLQVQHRPPHACSLPLWQIPLPQGQTLCTNSRWPRC